MAKAGNKKRKICVFTATRAEYGLLKPVMAEVKNDAGMQLQIIVSGAHLSYEMGLTYREIEADGFKINKKIEILLSSDTGTGAAKSAGLASIGVGEALAELAPDIFVVLGDRFETLAATFSALLLRVPVAHIHGGELSEGALDDSMRHAITKMSCLHFTAAGQYSKRVVQLGEAPSSVFNFGAPGVENIRRGDLLDRNGFEKAIGFELGEKNLLITYHPETAGSVSNEFCFNELLLALKDLRGAKLIFSMPNADAGSRSLKKMIDRFVSENGERAIAFESLGRARYLSALKHVDAVVGNSSSGIIEAPSFKIGTINIGSRQLGRARAKSVIDCAAASDSIKKAIARLYSKEFQNELKSVKNIYEKKNTAANIKKVLKNCDPASLLVKKFNDIAF